MDGPFDYSAEEITRLRGCLSDLNRIMGLPAVWTTGEPSRIVSALLNELVGTLPLSFAFVRLDNPDGGPSIEMTRVAEPLEESTCTQRIGEALTVVLGDAPRKSSLSAR